MNNYKFDTNNYEFNPSSPRAVYLLHGFSSTTYEVKKLAQFLGDNGYHAIAKNLPGHGTNIEECNRIKFQDWINFVKKDIAILSSKSKKLFIIGNSMGGVLSLYIASLFPLNGFVVGGTVLKFKKYFSTNYLVPLLHRLIKTQLKNKVITENKVKFYGYNKYPLTALNEYRKMNKLTISLLKNISIPGLIIHSHADKTSIEENVDIILKNINSKNIDTVFVNKAHHNMFDTNPDQNLIFQKVLNFLNSN